MRSLSDKKKVSTTKEEFLKLFLVQKTSALLKLEGAEENLLLEGIYGYTNHFDGTSKIHKFEGYVVQENGTGADRRVIVELATTDDITLTGTIQFVEYKPTPFKDQ